MTKQKSTKKTLLTSILSLVLCMAMLVGTTFAWFTDSVTSGNNIIKSGNLDVNLYYWDNSMATGTNVSIQEQPDTKLFKNVDGEDILWEPGATGFGQFEVANEGSLALKYQLKLNFYNATETAPGSGKTLADVLSVYAVARNGKTGSDDVMEDDNLESLRTNGIDSYVPGYEAQSLNDFVLEGYLLPGESFVYELGTFWEPTSNDNDYNVKGGLSIDFGVTLLATQMTYEEDSYDDQYDADAFEDGIKVEKDGVAYIYMEDGEVILYEVLPEYASDKLIIPDGVTTLGNYSFSNNSNVKTVEVSSTVRTLGRAFDSSNVEKVVLNEGLEQIDSRAFKATTSLKEVVIPSTVKVIEDNAFQKSGIQTITIPATVETIGETAFGASLVETVIIEGNTSIQGYAFRGCTKLRNVYLNGDDVTFIKSTLNGRNSTWFCNGESNNPNTSNITFYVANDVVASRVKTAMGAEADNIPVIVGGKEITFVTVKNVTELQKALDNAVDGTIINFTADISGDATVEQKQNVKIIINGNNKNYKGAITINGKSATILTAGLTIKNVNFDATAITTDACINMGIKGDNNTRYVTNLTVENCTFTGNYPTAEQVGIKTYTGGGQNLTVKNCIANNMHSLAQIHNIVNVTFEDCTIVGSKNGISVGASRNAKITNCEMSVEGYGVRGDANEVDSALTITGCEISGAYIPVVIRKANVAKNSFSLTLNGTNTITGITNTDGLWCAIGVEEYGDVTKENLTAASANVTVTINDASLSANGVYGAN